MEAQCLLSKKGLEAGWPQLEPGDGNEADVSTEPRATIVPVRQPRQRKLQAKVSRRGGPLLGRVRGRSLRSVASVSPVTGGLVFASGTTSSTVAAAVPVRAMRDALAARCLTHRLHGVWLALLSERQRQLVHRSGELKLLT